MGPRAFSRSFRTLDLQVSRRAVIVDPKRNLQLGAVLRGPLPGAGSWLLTVLCGRPRPGGRAVHYTRLSGGQDGKKVVRKMQGRDENAPCTGALTKRLEKVYGQDEKAGGGWMDVTSYANNRLNNHYLKMLTNASLSTGRKAGGNQNSGSFNSVSGTVVKHFPRVFF